MHTFQSKVLDHLSSDRQITQLDENQPFQVDAVWYQFSIKSADHLSSEKSEPGRDGMELRDFLESSEVFRTQPMVQIHNQKGQRPKNLKATNETINRSVGPNIKTPYDVGRITRQGSWLLDTWEHLHHQNNTRRNRLDLTVSASNHRRNHITATSFRRSSEPVEPPPKPSIDSSLFEISSDKAKAPTLERQTRTTRSIIETQPLRNRNEIPKAGDAKLFHLPETRAGGDGAVGASTSRNRNPNYERLHRAITSKQPRLHSKIRNTTDDGWPELRQGGRRKRRGRDKGRIIYA
ncbi:hypothetical protein HID58_058943 [Brassica napus]|uniref:Uncharacterized protein n=1 Tax=Brassica napus TaxID=3708 RepID=A0ABQ7ZS31_BRANA|nr:hypothetical protein HID58_058943 [Brassica napus]